MRLLLPLTLLPASAALLLASPVDARRRTPPPAQQQATPVPPSAGGLIDNVNGYTMDGRGHLDHFTGLLIGKDGKVARLLGPDDRRPERLDFRLDGKGRTLLPGLIDAHLHLAELGRDATILDLSTTHSLAEAQDKLRRYAADHPNPRWIVGAGWNQEQWGLGRMPTAADLDAAVPDRPVWLVRIDSHGGVANSQAMADAGVTAKTATPTGGQVSRGAGGKPTGLFVDAARRLIEGAIPPPLPRERDEALMKAQAILLGYGITSACDMMTTADDWAVMRRAGDGGRLRIRIVTYANGLDPLLQIAGTGPTPWLYGDHLRMVGLKLFADGALGSRGAWLKTPYADDPTTRGTSLLDDAKMKNLMSRAAMDGFQVAIHAIGDAANEEALDAIDELSDTYKGDRRWRIEHAQVVAPADIARFGHHGIVASMQPTHATSDRVMAEARLGPQRLTGAYAWKLIAATGAPLAFGSDAPVEKPDPFAGMAAAISRQGPDDQPPGGWLPEERVSIEQAFAGYTSNAAYASFSDDRLGTLQLGHDADFVFVDRDPFTATADQLRGTVVEETWVGGQRAWMGKEVEPAPTPAKRVAPVDGR